MNNIEEYTSNLNRFFNDFSIINNGYLKHKTQADKYLSSDFDLFQYLNTDENSLSKYIAMMLDTQGPHGQQGLFLQLFIDFAYTSKEIVIPYKNYGVHREYQANGRIDIFLDSRDSETAIIIENKPYTVDQKDQLLRYHRDIKKRFKDVFMVYLSDEKDPSDYSIPKEILKELKRNKKFLTIALYDFGQEYLKKCYQACESQKFRFFLNDFMSFLTTRFKPTGNNEYETVK